jgi:hypothetical protein
MKYTATQENEFTAHG